MIIAATGHRPNKIPVSQPVLIEFACDRLRAYPVTLVISGMAQGWDEAVAEAARRLDIPYIAAVPSPGYGKRYWFERLYAFMDLCVHAQQVEIVSETPSARSMQLRNEWMVDRADRMLALWDGSWGGTFNCIEYAKKRGVPVDNCWPALDDPEILV